MVPRNRTTGPSSPFTRSAEYFWSRTWMPVAPAAACSTFLSDMGDPRFVGIRVVGDRSVGVREDEPPGGLHGDAPGFEDDLQAQLRFEADPREAESAALGGRGPGHRREV